MKPKQIKRRLFYTQFYKLDRFLSSSIAFVLYQRLNKLISVIELERRIRNNLHTQLKNDLTKKEE